MELYTQSHGKIAFKKGQWSKPFPGIEIFDARFIHDNVFRGSSIELNHRRNLYQFILGEQGVSLARRLLEIDQRIREIDLNLKPLQKEIEASIVGTMPMEAFLELTNEENVAELIERETREVTSLAVAHEIRDKDKPSVIELPRFEIDELDNFLQIGIDDVSEIAAKNIAWHIKDCMDENGESWIFQGLQYIRNDECPFCKQDISASDLVGSFRKLFREAYKALKKSAKDKIQEYDSRFSESQLRNVNKRISENESLFQFWKDHAHFDQATICIKDIYAGMDSLKANVRRLLNQKCSSPAEPVDSDHPFLESVVAYQKLIERAININQNIIVVAKTIDETKSKSIDSDLEAKKRELSRLLSIQKRYESGVSASLSFKG